ncbi:MAG: Crp/Fnr family transcriptional regulator [Fibrobacterota bacterium]
MPGVKQNKIRRAGPISNRHERIFKRGSLMTIEGETIPEMYIIKRGKVKMIRQEGEQSVILAVLGPGAVLGELSLLDNQPSNATAVVLEETAVTTINKAIFDATVSRLPSWLVKVIKVVVKRLGDTTNMNRDDLIRNNIGGVINILLGMSENRPHEIEELPAVDLMKLKENVFDAIGLPSSETDKIILLLIIKEMVLLKSGQEGREYVCLINIPILKLYMEYFILKQKGASLPGTALSDSAFSMLELIKKAGEEKGKKQGSKIYLTKPVLELELERSGSGKYLDPDILDELQESGVAGYEELAVKTGHGTHKQVSVFIDTAKAAKALLVKEWIETFNDDQV